MSTKHWSMIRICAAVCYCFGLLFVDASSTVFCQDTSPSETEAEQESIHCGPASAYLFLKYLGNDVTVKEIMARGPRNEDRPDGWSLQDLKVVIESYGHKMEPLETTLRDTLRAKQPFILHTNLATGGHFMLVIPGTSNMRMIDPLSAKPRDVQVSTYLGVTRLQDNFHGLFVATDANRILQRFSSRTLAWFALAIALCITGLVWLVLRGRMKSRKSLLGLLALLLPTTFSCSKRPSVDSLVQQGNQAISRMPFQIEEVTEIPTTSDGRFYSQQPFTSRLKIRNTSGKLMNLAEIKIANSCCSPAKLTKFMPEQLEPGDTGWLEFEVNLQSPVGTAPYSIMLASSAFPESSINVNREVQIVPSDSRMRFLKPADFGAIDRSKETAETILVGLFESAEKPKSLRLDKVRCPDFIHAELKDEEFTVENSVYGGYTIKVPIRVIVHLKNQEFQSFSEEIAIRVNGALGAVQCFGFRTGPIVINNGKEMSFPVMSGQSVRRQFMVSLLNQKRFKVESVRELDSDWFNYEFEAESSEEHLVQTKLKAAPESLPAQGAEFRIRVELADEDGERYSEEFTCHLSVYQPPKFTGNSDP